MAAKAASGARSHSQQIRNASAGGRADTECPIIVRARRGQPTARTRTYRDIRCVYLSSGDGVSGLGGWREGRVLVVVLAGGQAVVETAEESVEQVALGGG